MTPMVDLGEEGGGSDSVAGPSSVDEGTIPSPSKKRGPEWRLISTAPRNGTEIQAKIPGHGSDNVIVWTWGMVDESGRDCGGWAFARAQEPPDCWTDGYCWAFNEDGKPSVKPTHWKPIPFYGSSQSAPDASQFESGPTNE